MSSDLGMGKGSLRGYVIGYVLSLLFTLDSYLIVTKHLYSKNGIMGAISGLALIQLIIQLLFFLHLGRDTKRRWNLIVFGFMLFYVLLVVVGSLWIFHHLNYNMNLHQQTQYLRKSDSL